MILPADTIAADRRNRRHLRLWRVLAIVAVLIALLALSFAATSRTGGLVAFTDHVARVRVSGLITGDAASLKLFKKLAKSDRVKAVIVSIDSPGGTTAGSEAIYLSLRQLAEKKPVVSVMGSVAASGGYIAALASDHVVARGNTITGSIGVIFQWAQLSKLLTNAGIEMRTIKSGELKAQPNMFEPMPEKARQVTEAMVQDSFDWFTGLVETRRKLPRAEVLRLSDGRVFTGRQALKEKLIDAIGSQEEALKWLQDKRKIDPSLTVIDWKPKLSTESGLGLRIATALLDSIGLAGWAGHLRHNRVLALDGLMAVWHPELYQMPR